MASFGKRSGIVGQSAVSGGQGASKRRSNRWAVQRQGILSVTGSKHTNACTVLDLAAGGARVAVEQGPKTRVLLASLEKGVVLAIPIDRVEVPAEVRWRDGVQLGLRFIGAFRPSSKRHTESELVSTLRQWTAGSRSAR